VVGGSVLPWLAGTIAQGAGMRVLLPFAVVLALAQFVVWWPIARRLRPGSLRPAVPGTEVPRRGPGWG